MAAKTHHQTRQKADFSRFQRDSVPVRFGKDLTLELGLAESLKLLNDYQLATNGLWLEWQQEASDG